MMAGIPDILPMRTSGKGAPKKETGKPDPAKLIKGKYATTTWNHWTGEDDRLYCGIWESTPGQVKIAYDEWEFCHIISGEVVLRKEGAKKGWRFKKGDAFIIPAGFKGTWETVKKVRKHYVILLPKS
jgi:uncharacterized cupin superfamily protein